MSYIANAIDSLIKEKNQTAAELARASGITEAQISRFKSGAQVWVSAEDLINLTTGLAKSSKGESFTNIHARLLQAHLLDECSGPGAKRIKIELLSSDIPSSANHNGTAKVLPPRIQENLDLVAANAVDNRHIRDLLETVANLCRGGSLPPAH